MHLSVSPEGFSRSPFGWETFQRPVILGVTQSCTKGNAAECCCQEAPFQKEEFSPEGHLWLALGLNTFSSEFLGKLC